MQDSTPLKQWSNEFGADYRDRNKLDAATVLQAQQVFSRVFEEASLTGEVRSVLEVGCNVGINLAGLRKMQPNSAKLQLSAIEPNKQTCQTARENADLSLDRIECSDCYSMPFPDGHFDLVFTAGVLIHIPPNRLEEAMREITRVSKRFVMCMECFSHQPEEVTYHGQQGLLWKCDFGGKYLDTVSSLTTRKYGFIWMREFPHYDDLNWWVFEKQA
ncbi:MAG: pseudaminic acid biosynthesis-associated methylase [Chthoniobacterales bacterium]